MAAVFDIFGHLQWRSQSEMDEPRLCFDDDCNPPALQELLGHPVAGSPLEVLLGPCHSRRGNERDRWHRERQRLWDYAALEARNDSDPESQSRVLARKIALTCVSPSRRKFEIELFVRPCSAGRALFGILVQQGAPHADPLAPQVATHPLGNGNLVRSSSHVDSNASSSNASSEPLPLVDSESDMSMDLVSVWIESAKAGYPLLKSSIGFRLLSGPTELGMRFSQLLVDRASFSVWLQKCVDSFLEDPTTANLPGPIQLRLQPIGQAGSFMQFKAECNMDFQSLGEGINTVMASGAYSLPTRLVFSNITQYHIKRTSSRRHREGRKFDRHAIESL